MNRPLKIAVAVGAAVLLLLTTLYLYKSEERTEQANSIESIEDVIFEKTFRSKRQAYEAFANEKERFYHRSTSAFEQTTPQETPAVHEPKLERRLAAAASEDSQFDEAYREIKQNMDKMYEQNGAAPAASSTHASRQPAASKPEPVKSSADRRREAILRDWGMTSAESTGSDVSDGSAAAGMFRAVIHGTQLLKAGQPALFRTKESIRYGSLVVPANTLLSGVTAISENRLTVDIGSVRLGQQVFYLPLEVYGSDGMQGLPLNYDAVNKVAGEQTSSTAIQETRAAVLRYGGTVGRVAGALITGVGNQARSLKEREIKLIDNQTVILKITEKK